MRMNKQHDVRWAWIPHLGGCEHAAAAAHVAKGTLPRPVRATAGHTRDTGHRTASAPALCGGLHARLELHCIWLPVVLGDARVHTPDLYVDKHQTLLSQCTLTTLAQFPGCRMYKDGALQGLQCRCTMICSTAASNIMPLRLPQSIWSLLSTDSLQRGPGRYSMRLQSPYDGCNAAG